MILDIGPRSIESPRSSGRARPRGWSPSISAPVLARVKTLVWNGPFRRLRARAVRHRHHRGRRGGSGTYRRRQACSGRGWRRYGGGAQRRRGDRPLHLCFDRRRRLPRMAGGKGLAGGRGSQGKMMPTSQVDAIGVESTHRSDYRELRCAPRRQNYTRISLLQDRTGDKGEHCNPGHEKQADDKRA